MRAKTRGSTFYVSAYMSPPGPDAIVTRRHDQSLALWERTGNVISLARVWEFERLTGQKHHFWPLFSSERFDAFISGLLAEESVDASQVEISWGTPGLPNYRDIDLPAGAESLPLHSLGHLFSSLGIAWSRPTGNPIVALAIDNVPDFMLDRRTSSHWYAGCVIEGRHLSFSAVESPASLYSATQRIFGKEPGTLMALASAGRASFSFDIDGVLSGGRLFGGLRQARAIVDEIVATAHREIGATHLDNGLSGEENLQSAVMKVVQELSVRILEGFSKLH